MYALYPDKTDLRRKEYWWNLGQAHYDWKGPLPLHPNHAFINKWRDKVYSVNPEITEGSKSKLIAMEGIVYTGRLADLLFFYGQNAVIFGNARSFASDLNRLRTCRFGHLTRLSKIKRIYYEKFSENGNGTFRRSDIATDDISREISYFRDILIENYKP